MICNSKFIAALHGTNPVLAWFLAFDSSVRCTSSCNTITDKGTIRLATVDFASIAKAKDSDSWSPRLLSANAMGADPVQSHGTCSSMPSFVGFYGVTTFRIKNTGYRVPS